ncbi:hypothetical protein X274_06895 [Marinitoga sp. 1155]|nr:hypothetical protein X274_06895 [Marinitoga sp. 1155]
MYSHEKMKNMRIKAYICKETNNKKTPGKFLEFFYYENVTL